MIKINTLNKYTKKIHLCSNVILFLTHNNKKTLFIAIYHLLNTYFCSLCNVCKIKKGTTFQ